MKLYCDECKMERCSAKNRTAEHSSIKNSKSVPNVEEIVEQHTEEHFENGNYGGLSHFPNNENVNTCGHRFYDFEVDFVAESVQQPRSRSALGELNTGNSQVMLLGGKNFDSTFSPQNTFSENNVSIASKSMIAVKENEQLFGNNHVNTGPTFFRNGVYHEEPPVTIMTPIAQKTYSNNFSEKNSSMIMTAIRDILDPAPYSYNIFSDLSAPIATEKVMSEKESDEPPAKNSVLKAVNNYCDTNFIEEGSASVDIVTHYLLGHAPNTPNTFFEKQSSIAKEEMITEEEGKEPPANYYVPGALNTSNDICEEGLTTAVTDSHPLFGLAFNSQNIIYDKTLSVSTDEMITKEESKRPPANNAIPSALNTYRSNGFCEEIFSTGSHHLIGLASTSQSTISDKVVSMPIKKVITEEESEKSFGNRMVLSGINYFNDLCQEGSIQPTLVPHHSGVATSSQSIRPHVCENCRKSFYFRKILESHMRVHTGEKPYVCDICKRGFTRREAMVVHRCTHTGEKPYVCDICQRGFTKRQKMVVHRRTHTGEKPYVCDICQRGFTEKAKLVRHRRTHTGEKPYMCDICQRGFALKATMVDHRRIAHTFECKVCQRWFICKSQLKTHQMMSHSENELKN